MRGRGARLFLEDFESCGGSEEHLGRRGWVALQRSADKEGSGASGPLNRLMREFWGPLSVTEETGDFAVDEGDSVSGLRSLRMEKAENGPTVMTKIFSLPLRAPFAVSERAFAIVDREAGPVRRPDWGALRRRGEIVRGPEEAAPGGAASLRMASAGPSGEGGGGLLSVGLTGTYYVYGFDGRLLAEYNGLGICVRDYIYMGGKLIAEYRPQENAYLYYATDQIGSTRIVTDDTGAVVYAAAHDPWGGIQQTWTSAYDPALKFSGKERDTESGLDYFGARYYDHSLYRFLSVDPVLKIEYSHPYQDHWNLYAYCYNNPTSFVDPDGREGFKLTITRSYYGVTMTTGTWTLENGLSGHTLELPWKNNEINKSCIRAGIYKADLHWWDKHKKWTIILLNAELLAGRSGILIHSGIMPGHTKGCILVGYDMKGGELTDSPDAWKDIMDSFWDSLDWYIEWRWGNLLMEIELKAKSRGSVEIRNAEGIVIIVSVDARWLMI